MHPLIQAWIPYPYRCSRGWPWVGVDRLWVGDFPHGPDEKRVLFEVFFRDEKRFLYPKDDLLRVKLVCEDPVSRVDRSSRKSVSRITDWLLKEISAPDKTGTLYVRVRSELEPPRALRTTRA